MLHHARADRSTYNQTEGPLVETHPRSLSMGHGCSISKRAPAASCSTTTTAGSTACGPAATRSPPRARRSSSGGRRCATWTRRTDGGARGCSGRTRCAPRSGAAGRPCPTSSNTAVPKCERNQARGRCGRHGSTPRAFACVCATTGIHPPPSQPSHTSGSPNSARWRRSSRAARPSWRRCGSISRSETESPDLRWGYINIVRAREEVVALRSEKAEPVRQGFQNALAVNQAILFCLCSKQRKD